MTPHRRFEAHFQAKPSAEIGLPASHPAIAEGRTLFPSTVVEAEASPRLLVSGANQRKIGDRVGKGRWRGFPIFCLTLEERATCPRSCAVWRQCYGNGMPQSRRHRHGPALEFLLHQELAEKQRLHPKGFVVRLHILGDFPDLAYAALWRRWLSEFPALHVFGYTAHRLGGREGGESSLIAALIDQTNLDFPTRWAVRFSGDAAPGHLTALTIWREPEAPRIAEGIVCPAQTGRTECCGTCGLCWQSLEPIVFIAHGARFKQQDIAA